MNKVIVILGPTAVGKSALGIALAKDVDGEIISADATQIYSGLDIGSAKITESEMQGITHHLLSFQNFTDKFNAFMFVNLARKTIDDIISRGKTPIIVGGTNLYVTALVKNFDFAKSGNFEEIYQSKYKLNFSLFALNYPLRETLYNKINKRVDLMIKNGFLNEVRLLKTKGLTHEMQAGKGIGYRELLMHLNGLLTYDDAIEKIKQHSRNFAKRQLTWLRSMENIKWLDAQSSIEENKEIIKKIY